MNENLLLQTADMEVLERLGVAAVGGWPISGFWTLAPAA